MAFKDTITDGEVRGFVGSNFFYNLGSSVGYGCPNKRPDVLLVQYFLNVHNGSWSWIFGKKITVDGIFGGETWGAIQNFQKRIGYNGAGTVSSIRGNRYTSIKTKAYYTIIYLNESYKQVLPLYWLDIRRDPNMPKEVVTHLSGPLRAQV